MVFIVLRWNLCIIQSLSKSLKAPYSIRWFLLSGMIVYIYILVLYVNMQFFCHQILLSSSNQQIWTNIGWWMTFGFRQFLLLSIHMLIRWYSGFCITWWLLNAEYNTLKVDSHVMISSDRFSILNVLGEILYFRSSININCYL